MAMEGKQAPNETASVARLVYAGIAGQVVSAIAELGVADRMTASPETAEQLAADLDLHADSLRRLLRAAAALELVAMEPDGRFSITSMGERLRKGAPGSFAALSLFIASDNVQATWRGLAHSVRTGDTAIRTIFGADSVFDLYAGDLRLAALFDASMTALSANIGPAVVKAYDFSSARLCIDVGGGEGRLLAAILRANPGLRGTVYELPLVARKTRAYVAAQTLGDRCTVVEGDMFAAVPDGGDIYILSAVIHDWDDEDALKILSSCRRAMKPEARLLVLDRVLADLPPHTAKDEVDALSDINMMLRTGGRERSEAAFRSLLGSAGFSVKRVISTTSARSIVEAVPA